MARARVRLFSRYSHLAHTLGSPCSRRDRSIAVVRLGVVRDQRTGSPSRDRDRPGGHRQRARFSSDEHVFTTTPLPMPSEELARLARESTSYNAFAGLRIPRWVQAGSLLIALVVTWTVAQRVGPNSGTAAAKRGTRASGSSSDLSEAAPENLDVTGDSGPTFAFQARD